MASYFRWDLPVIRSLYEYVFFCCFYAIIFVCCIFSLSVGFRVCVFPMLLCHLLLRGIFFMSAICMKVVSDVRVVSLLFVLCLQCYDVILIWFIFSLSKFRFKNISGYHIILGTSSAACRKRVFPMLRCLLILRGVCPLLV